ncbi:hypothetical protein DY000_02016342 [Brassica cretica]|uniref:Uncharacterized protein n=1 Tax=Brassica cretica TaxID=69181 RepID=A0ABQ7CMT7_BRACR|nr:hypothetical protein DY000_02016342 [Brassica cretica]
MASGLGRTALAIWQARPLSASSPFGKCGLDRPARDMASTVLNGSSTYGERADVPRLPYGELAGTNRARNMTICHSRPLSPYGELADQGRACHMASWPIKATFAIWGAGG